ncbi:glycoside hydrolase family 92 protein [Bacteroides sp. CAG:709]|nr:glycoside hydrolase family 92 protein [Bacteroides sp. CAG:709]
MLKHQAIPSLAAIIILFVSCQNNIQPVDYVNPYMGNISHLLVPTYPTIHRPNQMLRLYPAREDFTSDTMDGLPMAVTSHRGKSVFSLYPASGELKAGEIRKYTYDGESISPYTWKVRLCEIDTEVRFAPSDKGGIYELKFSDQGGNNSILMTAHNGKLAIDNTGMSGYQNIDDHTRIYI